MMKCKTNTIIGMLLCLLGCKSSERLILVVDKVGTEIKLDSPQIAEFIESVKNVEKTEEPAYSPVSWITFLVGSPDTVTLLLHSLEANKTVQLLRRHFERGGYHIDFQKMGLPRGRYVLKYRGSIDSAMTAFWVMSNHANK